MYEKTYSSICYLLQKIKDVTDEWPGKKQLQKLAYLLQEKGTSLDLDYTLHFFGPYSADLDWGTRVLASEGVLSIKPCGNSHHIELRSADEYPEESLGDARKADIEEIVRRYKDRSPSQLELLATTIYAFNCLKVKTRQSISEGVRKIKGSKYSDQDIDEAINELPYFGKHLQA